MPLRRGTMASSDFSNSPLLREKQEVVTSPPPRLSPRKPAWNWTRVGVALLTVAAGVSALRHIIRNRTGQANYRGEYGHRDSSEGPPEWTEWSSITPSEKLVWHPCFGVYGDDFQCARLTVPMDYHRPLNQSADHPKVHLALVMKPARNRTSNPSSYSDSPLLINPGGPGGSGAIFALIAGSIIHTAIGTERDIIGFDPRGVGATTPQADCFASPPDFLGLDGRNVALMNRMNWIASGHEIGLINSSSVALAKHDVRARALAKLCQRVDEAEGDSSIFRYLNTPNVARDMLSIVHAWDEWRAVPATKSVEPTHSSEGADREAQPIDKLAPGDSTQGKLVYWGLSYGTVLGATFASMFPDKVGRLILDGVVDADHYVNPVAADNILDADAIWENFFVYCAKAGPRCPFSQFGETAEDLRNRYDVLMSQLEKEPAIVIPPNGNVPLLVTAGDLKLLIFSALYSPIAVFPLISFLLRAAAVGQLDSFASAPSPGTFCKNMTLPVWPDDAQKAIGCSDKRYKLDKDVPELQKDFEKMAEYSEFADIWMNVGFNLACNGWGIEAKDPPMRWDDHPAHRADPIDTSFPVLFLSNQLDPVTPLHAALKMTRKFTNASIVEQTAEGHCTVSCVSPCTIGHLRAYLDHGVVPPPPIFDDSGSGDADSGEWPVCACAEKPFRSLEDTVAAAGASDDDEILRGTTDEEVQAMMAHRELRNRFAHFVTFHQRLEYQNPLWGSVLDSSAPFAAREKHTCHKRP
ncbi:alpha/beta-hydrolase [Durotheca rogersii]|uniref:alpha/beta-hydrolase n=1 Tax=Durotheca rogersii TaxID=419775 RepID=UPI00221EA6F2|nr:alpha/beta-hydrolase [Durotheca rogersii]KAI5859503.1 alpha/beta-hydrolase [Durotheca rogersii]